MPARNAQGRTMVGRLWLAGMVAAGLLAGCDPDASGVFDAEALCSVGRVVVLPLGDAPGQDGAGSGAVGRGAALTELVQVGKYRVVDASDARLRAAVAETGYLIEDCYDPPVAAAVGARLQADAAVTGELIHYGKQQELVSTTITYVSGSKTETTHWVSLNLRIMRSADGKILYTGIGTASSKEGYSPACAEASRRALAPLKGLLNPPR